MCLTCGARARSVVTMEVIRTRHERAAKGRVESAMLDRCGVGTNCGWLSPADLAGERTERRRGAKCVKELRTHGREQQEGDGDRTREDGLSLTDGSVSRVSRRSVADAQQAEIGRAVGECRRGEGGIGIRCMWAVPDRSVTLATVVWRFRF